MIASMRKVGAATYAALKHLLTAGTISPEESVVFNTGAWVKHLDECFGRAH
jgi:threonine synthase